MRAFLALLLIFASCVLFAAEPPGELFLPEQDETIEADASLLNQNIFLSDIPSELAPDLQATPSISINFSREDFDNPLVEIRTTAGSMILELFPDEAPLAVANFIGLAEGTLPWTDPLTGEQSLRPLYDETVFHRVIEGFMVQGGSPNGLSDGNPGFQFRDEINARSLGLDKMQVVNETGRPHPILAINDQQDFQQKILLPLYEELDITSQAELDANIDSIDRRIRNMTVKESFENLGYQYTERVISRMPVRGVIAMANSGPNTNGSQFFITLVDTDWLAGKHTVFGKVRVGLEVLDEIGKVRVDNDSRPLQDIIIFSIRQLEP